MSTGVAPAARGPPPPCYVIIASIAKKLNIGMTMRSCVAFGVSEMWVAGGVGTARTFGSQGTERYIPTLHLQGLGEALDLAAARGVRVVAIEITPDAVPVADFVFSGPTAFVAGNEGEGLTAHHKALLAGAGASFVYIPQFGGGTASLNVSVATSIVLHHFSTWAGYAEQAREAGRDKFVVDAPPDQASPDGPWAGIIAAKRAERAAKKAARAAEVAAGGGAVAVEGGAEGQEGEGKGDGEGEGHGMES